MDKTTQLEKKVVEVLRKYGSNVDAQKLEEMLHDRLRNEELCLETPVDLVILAYITGVLQGRALEGGYRSTDIEGLVYAIASATIHMELGVS